MLKFFIAGFILLASSITSAQAEPSSNQGTNMGALVSAQWLSEHLEDPNLVILDCTILWKADADGKIQSISGKNAYEQKHIPNAGFADLITSLSDQDSQFEFWMPSPTHFANAIAALGIGNDSRIVLYSNSGPLPATRLWWMLRWIGLDQVAILDGGLAAWEEAGLEVSADLVLRKPNKLTIALHPELIANTSQVRSAIDDDDVVLIDALPEAHYTGKFALYSRAGHISSAINMPTSTQIDGHYFRSYDELDLMFDDDRSKKAITYCGGGIAATAIAFNMHRVGFTDVSVYMPSLQEWSADSKNPMTTKNQLSTVKINTKS